MPFLVRWPARVQPAVSDALICQVDFPATFAALTGQPLSADDAPDSFNILPALLGESPVGRDHVVEHGVGGIALRRGDWKYIPPAPGPRMNTRTNIELGNAPQPQLYNLADDPGEQNDLAAKEPGKLQELAGLLEKIRKAGRSRP